jgi:hypothetical protein
MNGVGMSFGAVRVFAAMALHALARISSDIFTFFKANILVT